MSLQHVFCLIPDSLPDIWIPGQLVQTERHCGWRRLEPGEKEKDVCAAITSIVTVLLSLFKAAFYYS